MVIRVRASGNSDVTVDTDAQADGNQNTLTFTMENYGTAQIVTVRAAEDDDAANDTATITHSIVASRSSNEYDSVTIAPVSVNVADDDVAGVTVSESNLQIDEGRSATYTVRLDTLPVSSVRITASSDNDAVTVSPTAFTLSRSNWKRGQTVTLQAPHDENSVRESVTITHAIDASRSSDEYDGLSIADVTVTVIDDESPVDYDLDNDGLIEIGDQAQLSAVRYDLNGDGVADNADNEANRKAYAGAFPYIMQDMCRADFTETAVEGDPGPCTGYELSNDIALSGSWAPIGGNLHYEEFFNPPEYRATFDGNGLAVSGLRINLGDRKYVGLFGATGSEAVIRDLGLENVSVSARAESGALAGLNHGTITGAWVTGSVSGNAHVGGLAGSNRGTVERSYSKAQVKGTTARDSGGEQLSAVRTAGLVGLNYGTVRNTYAAGEVTGDGHVAGLVGWNNGGGRVENSYAAGRVASLRGFPSTGGLVGWQTGAVSNSYWDTETTGQRDGAGQGDVPANSGKTTADLQKPTGASGIYAAWNGTYDVENNDGTTSTFTIWNFGTVFDYPCLRDVGDCGAVPATAPQREAAVDYDADGDGLIEIRNQAQLNAIRWDMDGDAKPDDGSFAGDYAAAFPRIIEDMCAGNPDPAMTRPGDPGAGCNGYELMKDISLSGTFKPLGVDGFSYFTSDAGGQRLRDPQPAGQPARRGIRLQCGTFPLHGRRGAESGLGERERIRRKQCGRIGRLGHWPGQRRVLHRPGIRARLGGRPGRGNARQHRAELLHGVGERATERRRPGGPVRGRR